MLLTVHGARSFRVEEKQGINLPEDPVGGHKVPQVPLLLDKKLHLEPADQKPIRKDESGVGLLPPVDSQIQWRKMILLFSIYGISPGL